MFSKSLVTKLGCVLAVMGAALAPATGHATTGSTEKTLIDWEAIAQQKQEQFQSYKSEIKSMDEG